MSDELTFLEHPNTPQTSSVPTTKNVDSVQHFRQFFYGFPPDDGNTRQYIHILTSQYFKERDIKLITELSGC